MRSELLHGLLSRALEEELGLVVTTNNPHGLSLNLHDLTKGEDRYSSLIITVPSLPETVMIVKRTVELDDVG